MRVLVLGHRGMLGKAVCNHLMSCGERVETITSRWNEEKFKEEVLSFDGDYIINCIGAIPQREKTFRVNVDLPVWLSNNAKSRVIHPGTDCEKDEDEYGKSKRLAREYIELFSKNTKVIKCSIIGFDENNKSLLSWFLTQTGKVEGYSKALWNGITTLEWAKQAHSLMLNWERYATTTVVAGETLSKYEMLCLFKKVFGSDAYIERVDIGKDKTLCGDIQAKSLELQLIELKSTVLSSEQN